MAYIGREPLKGQNRSVDNISSGFNGSATTFNLTSNSAALTPASAYQLFISVGGVLKSPGVDFTVNGNQITFTTAPASGLTFFGLYQGDAIDSVSVSDGAITTAKLATGLTVTLGAGSASTPSLTFAGDTNNGIYSPGADQLAISTNGTGRLFVDASGNVGVGPNTPQSIGSNIATIHARSSSGAGIAFGSTSFAQSLALFTNGDGTIGTLGTYANMPLTFVTNSTERMRLDASGRLGLGTSSPSSRLNVASANNDLTSGFLQDGATTGYSAIQIKNTSGNTLIGVNSSIAGTLATNALAYSTVVGTYNSTALHLITNDITRATIDTSGNLGIGTTAPSVTLHTQGTIRASRSNGESKYLDIYHSGGEGFIDSVNGDVSTVAPIVFRTGNSSSTSEKARLTGDGKLLVGTSTSSDYNQYGSAPILQVIEKGGNDSAIGIERADGANASDGTLKFRKTRSSTPGGVTAVASGDGIGSIQFFGTDGTNEIPAATIVAAVDGTPGANDMPGRLVFSTTADGASSPTERMRITSGGAVLVGNGVTQGFGPSIGYMLAIRANSGTQTYFSIALPGQTADSTGVVLGLDTTTAYLTVRDNKPLKFTTNDLERMSIAAGGSVTILGALSKGSGSFRIDHPLPEKTDTHQLVHSFIEGPQADLIYRGHVTLQNGTATINIDTAARITEGTFEALCGNVCCFTTNESDWTAVKGSVTGNILTIEAQDPESTAEVCWMVIGERKDKHMLETDWTDEDGRVITEPLKEPALAEAS